jgi:hypothetical protein
VDVPESQVNLIATYSPSKPAHATATLVASKAKKLDLWHQRFGHVHPTMLIHMHNHNIVDGLELTSHGLSPSPCEGCAFGKNKCQPFSKRRESIRAEKVGQFFHSDVCGPMSVDSYGGTRYFVLFKDDCIGYRFVFTVHTKSCAFANFKTLGG